MRYPDGYEAKRKKKVKRECPHCGKPSLPKQRRCRECYNAMKRIKNREYWLKMMRLELMGEQQPITKSRERKGDDKYHTCTHCGKEKEKNEFAMHESCWQQVIKDDRDRMAYHGSWESKRDAVVNQLKEIIDIVMVKRMHNLYIDGRGH